jgi:uracil-DNA glycosylase
VQIDPAARILIASQAPGRRAHESGVPFDDPSGERLRGWLGVDKAAFYDPTKFAIVPMGFCFPGTAKGGDMPPRAACATRWRSQVLGQLNGIELTLVIGQYAMNWHLADHRAKTLTDTVKAWRDFWPLVLPIPHPSPRNQRWFKENAFFAQDILPALQQRVSEILR